MDVSGFAQISPTTLGDFITRDRVMDMGIRPLWPDMPRLVGPAYPVRCEAGDNLMLHVAIHKAPAGSVIVAQGHDCEYALAGGNVCALAQRRGIAGFVVDGVVRDIAETRERRFPVFGRGVIPIPGKRLGPGALNATVVCGGVLVSPGDIVVADEEGVVVVEAAKAKRVLETAQARAARDAATSLDEWEKAHRERVETALRALGMTL
jgi:regulator of RNase E activity RraA